MLTNVSVYEECIYLPILSLLRSGHSIPLPCVSQCCGNVEEEALTADRPLKPMVCITSPGITSHCQSMPSSPLQHLLADTGEIKMTGPERSHILVRKGVGRGGGTVFRLYRMKLEFHFNLYFFCIHQPEPYTTVTAIVMSLIRVQLPFTT